jgi:hypothetical protein
MILEQVKDFVITKIITAGITWLIGLLNPAAAFIKACKLIYDVVMFFVTNGSRIMAFVNTILDSVSEIVRGNVGAVVNKINDVLGQMIPLIIGFLASAIGLGGIGQKIREIITKLQKPINAALDFVIKKGLQLAGPVIRGLKGIGSKVKAKVASGKAWVKGKAEAGKAWVKKKAAAGLASGRALRDRLLGITFRRQFDAGGESHTMYTRKGAPRQLITASDPTPSAQAAPTPTVKDLEARFRSTIDQYVATAKLLERTPNDRQLRARAESLKLEAHATFEQLVLATKVYITGAGARRSGGKDPNRSAKGIGRIGRHGSKPSSERGGHRLHWLESEHVIPFATGKSLFRALSQYLPWRGSRTDNAQTTIMIYERAARIKTPADNAASYQIKALVENSGVIQRIARGRLSGMVGLRDADADDALAAVAAATEAVRKDAVARTVEAVAAENQMIEPGASKTNGQRRGGEAPTPTASQIASASRSQYDSIVDLAREEVEHQREVGAKVERIKSRPPRGVR